MSSQHSLCHPCSCHPEFISGSYWHEIPDQVRDGKENAGMTEGDIIVKWANFDPHVVILEKAMLCFAMQNISSASWGIHR